MKSHGLGLQIAVFSSRFWTPRPITNEMHFLKANCRSYLKTLVSLFVERGGGATGSSNKALLEIGP